MATPRGATGRAIALIAATLWLALLWRLSPELRDFKLPTLTSIPIEIVILFVLIASIPMLRLGRGGRLLRHVVALTTLLAVFLSLADLGVRASLARPLTPLLDLHLLPALVNLATGTLHHLLGWLGLAALILLLGGLYLLTLRATAIVQGAMANRAVRRATLGVSVVLVALFVVGRPVFNGDLPRYRLVTPGASATLWQQWRRSRTILAALDEFEQTLREDAFVRLPPSQLLTGLAGVDVLLMYFESYGRSALEQERYAEIVTPKLDAFEQILAEHGLVAASGYLTSPTVGGQSWLAHGTLEGGLWLDHQGYYDSLVTSDRLTLTKAFAKAGYRTVAIKPAITMPWPEGTLLGYQQIYDAAALRYAGKPFNWVTMPDQYTLAEFERAARTADGRPVFAAVSLISSHAPWTPIPPLLDDWATIGDGRIFSRWAEGGDPPEVVWRDPERVRAQYVKSVGYVLDVLAAYAARFVDQSTLMIVVGDHQPAPLITGEGANRDVPIHIITGDPTLLEPFLEWGMVAGMHPSADAPVWRMDGMRDWFLATFSTQAGDTISRRTGQPER